MADQDGERPEETQGAGETPETEGEEFDATRAMELIRKLRAENKNLGKSSKRVKELEDAEAQRAQGELSESEKAKKIAADAQQVAQAAQAALAEATLRYEFMLAALRPGSGVEPAAAEAAWKLVDRESIEIDEQGQPKEIGKALKELVRQYPFLAAKAAEKAPNINAGETGKANGTPDAARMDELKRRFRL
jgi:hypothetical protein